MADRLAVFQRNSGYGAFICVLCFAAAVFLAETLSEMIIPFMWAAFFAMPLSGLISSLDRLFTTGAHELGRLCSRRTQSMRDLHAISFVEFTAEACSNCVYVRETPLTRMFFARVNTPCFACTQSWPLKMFRSCCRRRLKVVELSDSRRNDEESLEDDGNEVNRLVKNWNYYIKDIAPSTAVAPEGASTPLATFEEDRSGENHEITIELFLDAQEQYPAVIQTEEFPLPQGRCIHGKLEIDRTSSISFFLAALTAVAIVVAGIAAFAVLVIAGVKSLEDNLDSYKKGVTEFIDWFGRALPDATREELVKKWKDYVQSALPGIASQLLSLLANLGGYFLFFFIYLCFWIFEPLPINSDVSKVFKTYLMMKTLVCLLFALMMMCVLLSMKCPLWHLFTLVTFLLNYIPEIGPLLAAFLMTPAVLFDGQFSIHTRLVHFTWLAICGVLAKIITGNFIEVYLYSSKGGQFMRMHPVFLLATMMICYVALGITGMFLSIPIVAAMKYYMLSSQIPATLLNPMLVIIEGEEAGPHKNFVDKHRKWEPLADSDEHMETATLNLLQRDSQAAAAVKQQTSSELGRREPEPLA